VVLGNYFLEDYYSQEKFSAPSEIQFSNIFDQIIAYTAGTPINVVNLQVLQSPDLTSLGHAELPTTTLSSP
jgi:hypothetical protein